MVTPKDFMNKELKEFLLNRRPEAHKGDYGRVMMICGSKDYSGSPALAGIAALRTGSDWVECLVPAPILNTTRSYSPNLIASDYKTSYFGHLGFQEFKQKFEKFDSFLIGPGLTTDVHHESLLDVVRLLKNEKKKFVVDADALKILKPEDLKACKCIITPHAGELKIFNKGKIPNNICTLLKGHVDKIQFGNKIAKNATGNPGMTVGGCGDVLAGVCAALVAQTDDLFKAACSAAYITGLAGDLAHAEFGNQLLATDVIDKLPNAIKKLR